MTDGLEDAHRAAIVDVLAANERVERAVLFGSRATETFTDGSDVDIALFGEELTIADRARLAEAMEELTVPHRVDVLLYDGIDNETLRKHIRRDGIEWYGRREDAPGVRLHLKPEHRRVLEALLRERLPGVEVWAYGSRVSGRSHDGSDLDLVLRGPGLEEIPAGRLADFEEAARESALPFLVEARDWARLPERFHREIERDHVVLVGKSERGTGGDWPTAPLGDCIEINDSTYSPKEEWPFVNYLDTGSITENRVAEIQHLVVGRDKIPSRARRKVRPGEIVYSTVRPNQRHFGLLRDIPENFLASTGFSIIAGKEGVACTDFIYWFLAQDRIVELLHSIAEHSTTAYPSIRPSDIERLEIELPPLPEQRAIAHVLGTLDDRIELNRRMNETLEAMAQAVFKDWFVDFGPVRAKMEGRAPYLPEPLWSLFPDRLTDSEIGGIPEGWVLKLLGECFSLKMGQSPPGNTYNDHGEGLPFFQGRTDFGFRYPENRKYCNAPTRIAMPGDTLVSVRAPVGDLNMAWTKCCIGRGVAALRHKSGSSSFTYYSAWTLQRNISVYEHTGTVFGAINKKQLEEIQTLEPQRKIVEKFDVLVNPLDCRVRDNTLGIRILTNLRDTLLPKLISGDIRVPEAGKMLEAVA